MLSRQSLWPGKGAWLATLALFVLAVAILFAMDRPAMCACGSIKLWHGVVQSSENSQHITDWYAPSHFTHGLLMAGAAFLLWRKWHLLGGRPAAYALPIAVFVEAAWEIAENSPIIINRYREVTISWGYSGDSIVNSAADIGWMTLGFLVALRLPWWASVALGLFLELLALAVIRDNLTLNVLMLLYPIDAVAAWQAG
jgi:Protein of unknown function (DUF2585)